MYNSLKTHKIGSPICKGLESPGVLFFSFFLHSMNSFKNEEEARIRDLCFITDQCGPAHSHFFFACFCNLKPAWECMCAALLKGLRVFGCLCLCTGPPSCI